MHQLTPHEHLLRLARAQRGLIAVRQAPLVGHTASQLGHFLRRQGWQQLVRGVWLAAGAPRGSDWRLRSALLAVGAPVAATAWTACAVHGLRPPRTLVQLVVPNGRRAARLHLVQTVRSRTFTADQIQIVDGIAVVPMARAITDLAGSTELETLRNLVVDTIQQRLLILEDLMLQLADAGAIRGRGKVQHILRQLDTELVDSTFERLVVAWLRELGFTVATQHRLDTATGSVHLDIAIVELRIAIECDGFLAHRTREQLDVDRRRQNAIVAAGWRVLRITWDRFTDDRAGFAAELTDLIARH